MQKRPNWILALLQRWIITALGVLIAAHVIPGIGYDDTATLVVVILMLSLFNALLKPILVFFTLPFIIATLGLGVLLINAALLGLTGYLVDGFTVETFWAALGGALLIGLTSLVANLFLGASRIQVGRGKIEVTTPRSQKLHRRDDDDVIDI